MGERAGAYLRVSTDEQSVENQREALTALGRLHGYERIEWYEEVESSGKSRPILDRILADAKRRHVTAILVWALDRMHRSMLGTIHTILDLDRQGIPVYSAQESWLDTQGPVRQLLLAIFGWVAEQERARIRERTKAGLARARAAGKILGAKPRKDRDRLRPVAQALWAGGQGKAIRAIARELKVPPGSVFNWVKGSQSTTPGATPRPNGA